MKKIDTNYVYIFFVFSSCLLGDFAEAAKTQTAEIETNKEEESSNGLSGITMISKKNTASSKKKGYTFPKASRFKFDAPSVGKTALIKKEISFKIESISKKKPINSRIKGYTFPKSERFQSGSSSAEKINLVNKSSKNNNALLNSRKTPRSYTVKKNMYFSDHSSTIAHKQILIDTTQVLSQKTGNTKHKFFREWYKNPKEQVLNIVMNYNFNTSSLYTDPVETPCFAKKTRIDQSPDQSRNQKYQNQEISSLYTYPVETPCFAKKTPIDQSPDQSRNQKHQNQETKSMSNKYNKNRQEY